MKHLVFMVLIVCATSAAAVDGQDVLGFLLEADDVDPRWDVYQETTGPFHSVTVYLMIGNPSLGGASGWEGRIEILGSPVAWSWLTGDTAIPELVADFRFTFGTGPAARRSNSANMIWLATGTGFIMNPNDVVNIEIKGIPGSTDFPGTPGYIHPDDDSILQPLTVPVGDYEKPSFVFNGEPPVAREHLSWGEIKTLYR